MSLCAAHACRCLGRPEEGVRFPRVGVPAGCALLDVGAGNPSSCKSTEPALQPGSWIFNDLTQTLNSNTDIGLEPNKIFQISKVGAEIAFMRNSGHGSFVQTVSMLIGVGGATEGNGWGLGGKRR